MPAMTTMTTKPISIPNTVIKQQPSYREIIKQLAAQQTTKPYGDIPPLKKKRNKISRNKIPEQRKPMRRMSHVEDWIVVDSKESLPDEEELVQGSPFRNFLSADFFTDVLPLHMPPPSSSVIHVDEAILSDEEEEEEEEEYDSEDDDDTKSVRSFQSLLHKRHSVSSFQNNTNKSSPTSSTTTASYAVSSSPPHLANTNHEVWKATLDKLKRTLISVSPPPPPPAAKVPVIPTTKQTNNKKKLNKFIPMPIPPRRPISQKRRSEATTQPRFNPDTNTYTRDTRSNPDHLRMISAELNMMRCRKLLSPLKPRGFLPRRKDAFITGVNRKRSALLCEIN